MPESFSQLKDILNGFPEAVMIVDRNNKIIFWNREAEVLTGWSADEVKGKGCSDGILNHYDGMGNQMCGTKFCALSRITDAQKPIAKPLLLFTRKKTGAEMLLEIRASPAIASDGSFSGVVQVFHEVEREQREDIVISQRIVRSMVPIGHSSVAGMDLFVRYQPHSFVGGDFVNFLEQNGEVYLCFGDSEGEGVSAALISVLLSGINFMNIRDADRDNLSGSLGEIHRNFCEITKNAITATMILGHFHPQDRVLTYASAGHPEIFLYSANDGSCRMLPFDSHFLGILDQATFEQKSVNLAAGDLLLFYTDGTFEFKINEQDRYGQKALFESFRSAASPVISCNGLVDRVYQDMQYANAGNLFSDDVTLMAVRVK
ncbi:MAG: SpoIIE family protein phosphatase [Candidatus Wallbacteria bacterium]|nr:SpoIIE family protein phosphatase [Candidatus Wallbacteria bacterium]